jgi:DNA polymerase (family X)
MINLKLANILTDIAEIKKSTDTGRDIISNLVTAARTLRDMPGRIDEFYNSGRIKELYGMEGLAYELVWEYIKTGSISLYDELKSIYTEDLIRLVRISGFGKKRMFAIYEDLNIKSLEDLKDKLEGKNVSEKIFNIIADNNLTVSRDSSFYADRLRESIRYLESTESLCPRWRVELYIDEIISGICGIKGVKKAVVVGSLRRKKQTIEDIDILVLPEFNRQLYSIPESKKLLEDIKSLKFIKEFKGSDLRPESVGGRYGTVFGIELELIVSSYKNWAVDMLYTTGSRRHIKRIEDIAGKKGYVRNGRIEIGLPSGPQLGEGEELPPDFSDDSIFEKNIYSKLGLQYIPPELREDRGEVELAGKHSLPLLLELEDIKGDLHVHSKWSDGSLSIDDMIEKIRRSRYEYLAITDHSPGNYYGRGLGAKALEEKTAYVNMLKSKFKDFRILMGSEIDIKGVGKIDYADDIVKKLDIAIGSMHSNFIYSEAENTAMAISAVKNKYLDFIGHPTGAVFGSRAPYFINMDKLIEAAAKNNKALEINSYFLRMDLNEQNARKASEMGVKLVINTDSHRPNNLDMMRLGIDVARRAGLEKKDILNTLSFDELMKWKRSRN